MLNPIYRNPHYSQPFPISRPSLGQSHRRYLFAIFATGLSTFSSTVDNMRSYMQTTLVLAAIACLGFANDPQDDHEDNPCKSYGIDFQDRGAYFQNISSKDPFTFVSTFEGCQPDYANNILVDPYGDQHMCSDTPLTPDDKPQMSTCDLHKNELWTGPWSVIIISNNGEAEPIAYMRDFNLTVAEPATTIVRLYPSIRCFFSR